MLVLVTVLAVTNLATLAALVWLYRFIDGPAADRPDPLVAAALDATPPAGPTSTSRTRRLISVEVLNPIELAGSRGRLAGLAGSIAPRLTRRVVNDQVVKILRQQLVEQQVVADVRLHTVHPVRPDAQPAGQPTVYADEVAPVELAEEDGSTVTSVAERPDRSPGDQK